MEHTNILSPAVFLSLGINKVSIFKIDLKKLKYEYEKGEI
jgi:hypothetical protein